MEEGWVNMGPVQFRTCNELKPSFKLGSPLDILGLCLYTVDPYCNYVYWARLISNLAHYLFNLKTIIIIIPYGGKFDFCSFN